MTRLNRILSFGGDVRSVGEWRFESGAFVQMLAGGGIPTDQALVMMEALIVMKRDELRKIALQKHQATDDWLTDYSAAPAKAE